MEYSDFLTNTKTTMLDRFKVVCTTDDLAKLKEIRNKADLKESCSREMMITKWRLYKLAKLTVLAALLKDVPIGCRIAVLPNHLLRNGTINCLAYEEKTRQPDNNNLSVFHSCALHLHSTQRLEEKLSETFSLFMIEMDILSANQIKGVHMNDSSIVESDISEPSAV